MATVTTPRQSQLVDAYSAFVYGVSKATDIDPRVLVAWTRSEGHPGDEPGYFNWLNIKQSTATSLGEPSSGGLAGTARFPNLQTGIDTTVKEIESLGLTRFKGETPAQEISDIAASPWASSHYGGPGGPNLASTFGGIFGGQAGLQSPYQGPGTALEVAATAGTGSASGPESYDLKNLGTSVKNAASALNPLGFFQQVWQWLLDHLLRLGLLLAGGALIIIGVLLVARSAGATPAAVAGV